MEAGGLIFQTERMGGLVMEVLWDLPKGIQEEEPRKRIIKD